jgi:protein-L-isoaspartate O-methyltransferase
LPPTANIGETKRPGASASVVASDGFTFRPDPVADAIIVNAGVTHLSSVWLDALASGGGRLLVPLTNAEWWGCFVMITRLGSNPDRYRARVRWQCWVIPCRRDGVPSPT